MNRTSIPAPGRFLPGALKFFVVSFVFCSTFTIAGTQTALGISALFWMLCIAWKRMCLPARSSIYLPLIILAAVSLVAAALSESPREGVWNLRNYLLMIVVPLIGAVGADRRFRIGLSVTLLVSAAASGLYGAFVFLLGRGDGTLGRTSGSFSNAMTLGGVMLLLCSLFFSMAVSRGVERRIRYPAVAAFAATFAALFFSFTRSSWLGMICAMLVVLALQRRRFLPLCLIFILLFYLLMPAPYKDRIESIWDPGYRTNVQRMQMIEGGWRIFRDNWIIGVGPIDLAPLYAQRKPEEAVYVYGHLHNNFVNIAVTLGSVGLIVFLYLWFAVLRLMAGNLRSGIPPPERAWVAGSIGAIAGFLVNGLFEWNFADAEVITLVYIIIGSNVAIRAGLGRTDRGQGRHSEDLPERV